MTEVAHSSHSLHVTPANILSKIDFNVVFFLYLSLYSNSLFLTFAGAKSFAADADDCVMNAVVVVQATQGAVCSVVRATQESRLHNGTRVTSPVTHRHTCAKCPYSYVSNWSPHATLHKYISSGIASI